MTKALRIHLNGVVQGVGFRPFVYKLALELGMCGWVNNSGNGVDIYAEGDKVENFLHRVVTEAPPLSQIISVNYEETACAGYENFRILESRRGETTNVLISPDLATCPDCLQEIRQPGNRRFRYPFTNCTNCGPRYTIIREVPYDRERTTMASFNMCSQCASEYYNPLDRRFHAQPVACPECGPRVELLDAAGRRLTGLGVNQLRDGSILAVKGLGGFHLVCDAHNSHAVSRLRERKERGDKPFALMARDLETVQKYTVISALESELLSSPAAPIVISDRKAEVQLPLGVAPGLDTLGIMLPYTPLHYLLFDSELELLIMTSANVSGQPLIYRNEDALAGLQGIADYFLVHDREIYHPCDDSVIRVIGESPVFFRRARGYVPLPVDISGQTIYKPVLGVGAELKNSFCLTAGNRAFHSQYIGDINNYETYQRFSHEVESFQTVVNISPEVIAYDNHPQYQTTRYALANSLPGMGVQHHHAHLVSVQGEYGQPASTLGVICDGTGLGSDGHIWGFEFLWGNAADFERLAHLQYLPLPGGDAAAKHPLRIAYAYVKSLLDTDDWLKTAPLWEKIDRKERQVLDKQLESGLQVWLTSSAGRLFDAVSALLGVCYDVTYEGQAAIELEATANQWSRGARTESNMKPYEIELIDDNTSKQVLVLSVKKLFYQLIADISTGQETGRIAYRFHLAIAQAIVDTVGRLGIVNGPLVLNGGVFQNRLLTELVLNMCRDQGITVWRARELPPGDGGIAFGQVLVANATFSEHLRSKETK